MLEDKAILLADDDLTLTEMYEQRLKQEGAIIEVAHDGEEAIAKAEESKPSVILLDIMMPKFNGFEVLKVLKENDETKNIPVIVFTVLLESDKYEKARSLGAAGYLVKSESMPAEVVAKINEVLEQSQADKAK